jgi:phospholipid-binding lipoprotein MlaA
LGFFDPATKQGYETQVGDFGQTMYRYGLKSGPYLVLPVLGPSNVRDAIGSGVDSFIDPFRYVANANHANSATWGRAGTEGADQREQAIEPLDDLKRNSVDFYAQLRSIVRQRRAAQLGEPLPGVSTESADLYADPLTAAVPTQGRKLNHQ